MLISIYKMGFFLVRGLLERCEKRGLLNPIIVINNFVCILKTMWKLIYKTHPKIAQWSMHDCPWSLLPLWFNFKQDIAGRLCFLDWISRERFQNTYTRKKQPCSPHPYSISIVHLLTLNFPSIAWTIMRKQDLPLLTLKSVLNKYV